MLARVHDTHGQSAALMRAQLLSGDVSPRAFRAALTSVPEAERDAWVDRVLGIDAVADDGPDLPLGCAPYLPCAVDALLRVIDHANVDSSDVVVDVGAGVGRATTLAHLLTGAGVIGVEIQPELVREAHELASRLNVSRAPVVSGDAVELTGFLAIGTVFFLYCPFTGARLDKVLSDLESIARTRPIRIACVDLMLPPRPWLAIAATPSSDVVVYRSTFFPDTGARSG
jgi:SAM-dependent methyltransferase